MPDNMPEEKIDISKYKVVGDTEKAQTATSEQLNGDTYRKLKQLMTLSLNVKVRGLVLKIQ
jgi:hypothetical protein